MRKGRKIDRNNLPPILKRYTNYLAPRRSPSTIEGYLYMLLQFHKFMQQKRGKNLAQLGHQDFDAFLQELTSRKERGEMKQSTVKRYALYTKVFVKWLSREDILDSETYFKIAEGIKEIPDEKGEDNRKALSDEGLDQVHERLADPLLQMVEWTGENFGPRRMEYRRLRVRHLELEGEKPRLKIERSKGHNKKTRYLPLFPGQVAQWRKWLEYRKSLDLSHDYVFYRIKDPSKGPSNAVINGFFKKMSKITGVHLYPHKLRYTYAVRLWKHGVDIYVISRLLGHENVETTMRYLKIREKDFRQKFMEEASGLFY